MSGWTEPRATECHTLSIRGLLLLSIVALSHATQLFPANCCLSIAFLSFATLILVKHSTGGGAFRAIFPEGATVVGGSQGLPVFPYLDLNLPAVCAVSRTPAVWVAVSLAFAPCQLCNKDYESCI
jgi:hypothetical protein